MQYQSSYRIQADYQKPHIKRYDFQSENLESAVHWAKTFGIILHRWEKGEINLEQVLEKETNKIWWRGEEI